MLGIQTVPYGISQCPCSEIKVNGKLQHSSGKTANGPDPSKMEVWVTVPGKDSQPVEMLAEGKGVMGQQKVNKNTSYDYVADSRKRTVMV